MAVASPAQRYRRRRAGHDKGRPDAQGHRCLSPSLPAVLTLQETALAWACRKMGRYVVAAVAASTGKRRTVGNSGNSPAHHRLRPGRVPIQAPAGAFAVRAGPESGSVPSIFAVAG